MEINFENHEACVRRVMARGGLGKEEARAWIQAVTERADTMRRTGESDPVVSAAWGMSQDLKADAIRRKAGAVRDMNVRLGLFKDVTKEATTIDGAMNGIRGYLYPYEKSENQLNAETHGLELMGRWASQLVAKITKDGLMKRYRDPASVLPVFKELEKIRAGDVAPEVKATDSDIRKLAIYTYELQETMRRYLNGVMGGEYITDAKDYLMRMMHDPALMRYGGRDRAASIIDKDEAARNWVSDVKMFGLNEKTFEGLTPKAGETMAQARDNYLNAMWHNLYTNIHPVAGLTEGPKFEAGGYNMARKFNQGRSLIFDGPEATARYMQKYGRADNLSELMDYTIKSNAKRAGVMKYFGLNPVSNLTVLMRNIREHFEKTDPDGVNAFKGQEDFTKRVMDILAGVNDGPKSQFAMKVQAVGQMIRQWTNMGFLGSVALTHAASVIVTSASDALMRGADIFSGLGNILKTQFQSLTAPERIEMSAQARAFADGLSSHLQDPFGHGIAYTRGGELANRVLGGMVGVTAAMHDRAMTMTGIHWVMNHTQTGWRFMLMNRYGRMLSDGFDKLDSHEQRALQQYKIGPDEWKLLQTAELTKGGDNVYLTPDMADKIDSAAAERLLRDRGVITDKSSAEAIQSAIDGLRTDIGDRLGMLYTDAGHYATVRPGVRQQAWMKTSNPIAQELMRSMTQYMSWSLAATHQILARQIWQNATLGRAAWNIGILAAMGTVAGFLHASIRDLSSGTEIETPRTVGGAMNLSLYWMGQSGVFGVVGDWLLGELNRGPKGALQGVSSGGPSLGAVGGLGQVLVHLAQELNEPASATQSHTKNKYGIWSQVTRDVLPHLPYANLIYLKGALNYLLFWHVFNDMSPGWWQRTNAAMQKESGRTHIGFRPYGPVPYSPF